MREVLQKCSGGVEECAKCYKNAVEVVVHVQIVTQTQRVLRCVLQPRTQPHAAQARPHKFFISPISCSLSAGSLLLSTSSLPSKNNA